MNKANMNFKQYHVIIFLVDRCLAWLSSTATEHVCEQEMGEECKRRKVAIPAGICN